MYIIGKSRWRCRRMVARIKSAGKMCHADFLHWVQKKLEEGWQIYSCYEAEVSGDWLHRYNHWDNDCGSWTKNGAYRPRLWYSLTKYMQPENRPEVSKMQGEGALHFTLRLLLAQTEMILKTQLEYVSQRNPCRSRPLQLA
jgi:hypothetical protein